MKPLTLTDLPDDIVIHILSSLHPRDIVNIRRTCPPLSHISRQKAIWIDAVNQMCEQNTLLRPSFPLQELHLIDSSTLEDIATGPMKWEKLFSDNNYPLSQPNHKDAVKQITLSPSSVFKSNVCYQFLVPGGRFLLCHDKEVFAVFDLHSDSIDEPVARLSMNDVPERSTMTFAHPTSDLEKVQVVFLSMDEDTSNNRIVSLYSAEIYEISFPVASNPVIHLINSFKFLDNYDVEIWQECALAFLDNTFAFLFGDMLRLWNFRTNEWIVWRTDCRKVLEMIFLEKELLFIHDDSISFCNPFVSEFIPREQALPTTQPGETGYNYDYLFLRSERRLDNVLVPTASLMTNCFSTWFNGRRPPTCFERHMIDRGDVTSRLHAVRVGTFHLVDDAALYDMSLSDPPLGPVLVSQYNDMFHVPWCIPSNGNLYRPVRDSTGLYCRGISNDGTATRVVRDVRLQDLPDGIRISLSRFGEV